MITLQEANNHLKLLEEDEFDEYVSHLISAAEAHLSALGIDMTVDPLPDNIKHAALMLIGEMFDGSEVETNNMIERLIAPHTEKTL